MSRSAELEAVFGGDARLFRLPLGRLRALQEKTDCGPLELCGRLSGGTWRIDDVRETILQGLIGGGLDQPSATKLVMTYFDDLPCGPHVPLANAIVMAAVVGTGDEDLGEDEGEGPISTLSPDPN